MQLTNYICNKATQYVNMLDNYVNMQRKLLLHVKMIMFYVDTNKLHVKKIILHVDMITNLSCMKRTEVCHDTIRIG